MIKVGIIGSTGYAGQELVRLLLGHPQVEIVWYGSRSYVDKKYADVYRNMFQLVEAECLDDNMEELAKHHKVIPIFSQAAASTDTRFGSAREHLQRAEAICGCPVLRSVTDVEPIGPKKLLDVLNNMLQDQYFFLVQ